MLQHPPSFPDLWACNYDLIPRLKQTMCGKWFANREDILKLFGVRWQRLACQVMLMVFTASCHVGSSPKTIAGTTIKVGVAGVVVFVPYSLCMPQWNDKTMIKKTCAHWPPTSGSYTTICCNSSVHVTYFRTYIHNFLCCHILAKKKKFPWLTEWPT